MIIKETRGYVTRNRINGAIIDGCAKETTTEYGERGEVVNKKTVFRIFGYAPELKYLEYERGY